MAKAKDLTPISIANLTKPKAEKYEVSDGGCKGLRVIVFPSGKKLLYILRFRYKGVSKNPTLGPVLEKGTAEPVTDPKQSTPLLLVA